MEERFKVLSDYTRLRIVALLTQGEMCVCEIECSLKLTQSNASRHLAALNRSRILIKCKKAQWTFFRISEEFQSEHRKLWEYLIEQFPAMPTYKNDIRAYEECKATMPCRRGKE